MVRSPEEKWGEHGVSGAMRVFNDVINELQLVDWPMLGGSITWSNGASASRIDRFLVNSEWEDHFANATQTRLSRPVSDLWPVLLESGGVQRGPFPFRFENMWLKVDGFVDLIRVWWENYRVIDRFSELCASPEIKIAED